ncbi:MAG: hypothetical protein JWQ07_126 [Ramlibacter sp.]|nr:hypothetical protein [Ramlibacter sp.]
MSNANRDGKEHSDVAPILRAIFPTMSEADLRLLHNGFASILSKLYEDYMRYAVAPKEQTLDEND